MMEEFVPIDDVEEDKIYHKEIRSEILRSLDTNQFGFISKRGTTEAILELKEFTEDSLRPGDVVVVVSLDLKGAFDAAWWPAIIKSLKDSKLANLQLAGVKVEEKVTRGCPQESCCGPGFWNSQYNSLHNLNYSKNTKIITFADNVVILTKGKTVLEAENRVNIELDNVMEWSSINKINFNETKSQLMLTTRKRSLLGRETDVFLNNEIFGKMRKNSSCISKISKNLLGIKRKSNLQRGDSTNMAYELANIYNTTKTFPTDLKEEEIKSRKRAVINGAKNQFGFISKRGTTEAILELKEFTEDSLRPGDVVVVVSLDLKGAFDAAWWPAIIKSLKDSKLANLQLAGVKVEEKVTRGCPQESCCGPGFWNSQYNSLHNLNYSKNTKIITFADNVVILTKGKTVLEAENRVNIELDNVMEWSSINKINFNETKSQLMLTTRKRSLLGRETDVFLNNEIFGKMRKNSSCISKISKNLLGIKRKSNLQRGDSTNMAYGVPAWIDALQRRSNQITLKNIQRLINIKTLKSFRTLSYDAS
ncbi:Reverse transcriptase (RNA-dependent DNA polymerase) [Popillia japonica]|uniref:Reverse transcriptase (RNA-dependent DNA polymerase) n=1 Tax=Popillia japonica TaxID=7064 RepID=A0AAW1MCD0_POPJA